MDFVYKTLYLVINDNRPMEYDIIPTENMVTEYKPTVPHVVIEQDDSGNIAIEYTPVENGSVYLKYRVNPYYTFKSKNIVVKYKIVEGAT